MKSPSVGSVLGGTRAAIAAAVVVAACVLVVQIGSVEGNALEVYESALYSLTYALESEVQAVKAFTYATEAVKAHASHGDIKHKTEVILAVVKEHLHERIVETDSRKADAERAEAKANQEMKHAAANKEIESRPDETNATETSAKEPLLKKADSTLIQLATTAAKALADLSNALQYLHVAQHGKESAVGVLRSHNINKLLSTGPIDYAQWAHKDDLPTAELWVASAAVSAAEAHRDLEVANRDESAVDEADHAAAVVGVNEACEAVHAAIEELKTKAKHSHQADSTKAGNTDTSEEALNKREAKNEKIREANTSAKPHANAAAPIE